MKLDMGRAFSLAIGRISDNRTVVTALAGALFFLPIFAILLVFPMSEILAAISAANGNQELANQNVQNILLAFLMSHWWLVLILLVSTLIGSIGFILLIGDPARPALGDALRTALKLFIPYAFAVFLASFLAQIPSAVLEAIAEFTPGGIGVFMALVGTVVGIYLGIKFGLVAAIFCLERPIGVVASLKASWKMTKGNSARILGFYLLVGFTASIVMGLVFAVIKLGLSLLGSEIDRFLTVALIAALFSAYSILTTALGFAVYRQLSAPSEKL